MPKFIVTIGQDAWKIYRGVIDADSAADAEEQATWRKVRRNIKWFETDETREFDNQQVMEGEAYEASDEEIAALEASQKAQEERSDQNGSFTLTVSKRQHSTILAALRYYQAGGMAALSAARGQAIEEIVSDGGLAPLSDDEIDQLCEEINT